MKLPSGIEIVSLEERIGRVRLKAPFGEIRANEKLEERVKELVASFLWNGNRQDNFTYQRTDEILPKEEDYIRVRFRALSQDLLPGYWIDLTLPGVLEAGVEKLRGQTVYANHEFWDVEGWLGSVSKAEWDSEGRASGGVPGINAEYKIDALMNPRIARGLLMDPPAIHSTSLTFLFHFDFSHPRLVEEGKFWVNLGEEIEGEIVRLIVTEIREIWEASLVFQGADRRAKQIGNERDGEDFENLSAGEADSPIAPVNNDDEEKTTMKLTKEQITALGLSADAGEISETDVLDRALELAAAAGELEGVDLEELQARAAVSDKYVDEKREDVRRLARVAELGAEEGELDKVVAQQIDEADFERLQGLGAYYEKRAAERFPEKGRSSAENAEGVEGAGGVQTTAAVDDIPLHD
ncbi:MAG TPA: hypothetical protein VMM38_01345 [Aridibacter sp.]|nr:hypothetical protein [Aridibacter sp.]